MLNFQYIVNFEHSGSEFLQFVEECLAFYDGSSNILQKKDTRNRTVIEATMEFRDSLSFLPLMKEIEDDIKSLMSVVSRLKSDGADTEMENPKISVRNLVKRFFQKSLTKKEETYPCPDCPGQSPFKSFKAFQRHRKTQHSENVTSENLGARDEIKCLLTRKKDPSRLCLRNIKKVDICRHLKLAHGETRPKSQGKGQDKEFKGFFSLDQRKFTVAWGNRGENFPDEEMIEIEGDSPTINNNNVPLGDAPVDNALPAVALDHNPQDASGNDIKTTVWSKTVWVQK